MENNLKVTLEQIGNVAVLHLEGRLDSGSANQLETQARESHQAGVGRMLLDFKAVTYVASAGLRAVHNVYKMLTPPADNAALMRPPSVDPVKNPYLKLANLTPEVYYVFNVSGFLHDLAIYNDLETALNSFI